MHSNNRAILLILLIVLFSCSTERSDIEQAHAVEVDFEEAAQVSAQLADGLKLSLWAPGPLLSNAVALTFDNEGVAYVSETSRRKSSDLDIRDHWDWMTEDLALQDLEDTRHLHMTKLATHLSDENTWQVDLNGDSIHDYRDLEVESEYIRRVWDSDGDGRADRSQLYASGFNEMLTGIAAGILSHDDHIFLTVAPDLWKLRDNNGDGTADEREKIAHGFGIHVAFAGHDMSGLTMGPDGRVYWSIGDLGVNAVGPDGKRWAYPNQGAVMRANPDGSDFEVFAHGLRNPQEIAFDALGNLITVDNDGDHPGEHERYVHILEGSDSGWRINWQYGKYDLPNESYKVWMDEGLYLPYFPGQPAYIIPALGLAYDGPAGLAYNPGTALSPEWKDYFFASYFTGSSAKSKLQAFKMKRKGASFEVDHEKDILGGIVPTGITFAPDGALYINDWKDSYDKKEEGRIWKLDIAGGDTSDSRMETRRLLREGMTARKVQQLAELLGHEDRRVRMAAQFELVKRADIDILSSIALGHDSLMARIHAIWGIGQLARRDANQASVLQSLLRDKEDEVRAQAAKMIGDAVYAPALESLIDQLKDSYPPAQLCAAEALGKLGDAGAFQQLVHLLETVGDSDPHMRHSIVYALSRLGRKDLLVSLSDHSSVDVRIGGVVAMRILGASEIEVFLNDKDTLVLAEAARAINDDFSIKGALQPLALTLERPGLRDEAFIRRGINANLRLGTAASARRLATYASSVEAPEAMRLDALWALGYWSDPPALDRVDGRYRGLKGHDVLAAQEALGSVYEQLVSGDNTELKTAAIAAAGRLDYKAVATSVFEVFMKHKGEQELRKTALLSLSQLNSSHIKLAIANALEDTDVGLRSEAQSLLAKSNLNEDEVVDLLEKILDNNSIKEQQVALKSLATYDAKKAQDILKKWLEKVISDSIAPELKLDVLNAVRSSSFPTLKKEQEQYDKAKEGADVLTQYDMTLYGGDKAEGRQIFTYNAAAQCLRCHVISGYGGEVGPELTGIASKLNREELLQSLVDPSARVAPGYGTVILTLNGGEEVSGILQEETDQVIIIKVGNQIPRTIYKSDVVSREHLPSGMFDISKVLSKSQIRDLMSFLVTLE